MSCAVLASEMPRLLLDHGASAGLVGPPRATVPVPAEVKKSRHRRERVRPVMDPELANSQAQPGSEGDGGVQRPLRGCLERTPQRRAVNRDHDRTEPSCLVSGTVLRRLKARPVSALRDESPERRCRSMPARCLGDCPWRIGRNCIGASPERHAPCRGNRQAMDTNFNGALTGTTKIRGVKRLIDPVSSLPCPSRTAVSVPVVGSLMRIDPTDFGGSHVVEARTEVMFS